MQDGAWVVQPIVRSSLMVEHSNQQRCRELAATAPSASNGLRSAISPAAGSTEAARSCLIPSQLASPSTSASLECFRAWAVITRMNQHVDHNVVMEGDEDIRFHNRIGRCDESPDWISSLCHQEKASINGCHHFQLTQPENSGNP